MLNKVFNVKLFKIQYPLFFCFFVLSPKLMLCYIYIPWCHQQRTNAIHTHHWIHQSPTFFSIVPFLSPTVTALPPLSLEFLPISICCCSICFHVHFSPAWFCCIARDYAKNLILIGILRAPEADLIWVFLCFVLKGRTFFLCVFLVVSL